MFATDPILPPAPEGLKALHDREYRVGAWRIDDGELLIRGAVRDQKPPGLYLPDDPDPITIHHMQVELRVAFPSMEIVGAEVLLETHPHVSCPRIIDHYGELVGLSIARGFTHRVRELFGGPRGCTHTTALLAAMAPVAVQCIWSMQASSGKRGLVERPSQAMSPAERETVWRSSLNSCHVWEEGGEHVAAMRSGVPVEPPLPMQRRFAELGIDVGADGPDGRPLRQQ